jgi:sarcosine oxidase subunit alpha
MPARRVSELRHPVTITLDGEGIVAERGEPIATALLAADKFTLARSPKFHRPRGPSCLRAACDGCLARVNGQPNVMTCTVHAEEGTEVVSQNRFGSRENDLLRMTDWFFPEGLNHHELFAGVPGVQRVMQSFARRVAGLGRLPKDVEATRPAARRAVDAVVVGAGPSGMAIANELANRGRAVEVLDDQLRPGGSLRALSRKDAEPFAPLQSDFYEHVKSTRIRLRSSTVAGGIYGDEVLVVGPDGAEVLEARAVVLASGAHDGALAFEGNDLPGVMSARAAGFLLSDGVLAGKKIVVIVPPFGGPFGESFARAAREFGAEVQVIHGEPVRALGSSRVKGANVRTESGTVSELPADVVLVDAARSPAFELAEQAGANLRHEPRGFVVATEHGQIRPGFYATGELTGTAFDFAALIADAERVVAHIEQHSH